MEYERLFKEHSKQVKTEFSSLFTELKKKFPDRTESFLDRSFRDIIIKKEKRLISIILKDDSGTYSQTNYYLETVCRDFYEEYSEPSSQHKYKTNKITNFIENDLPEIKEEILSRFEGKNLDHSQNAIRKSVESISNEELIKIIAEYCFYHDYFNKFLNTNEIPKLEGIGASSSIPMHWTGSKVDLIKFIYAAYHSKQLNNGKGSITQICQDILEFFDLEYKDDDNALSVSISQANKNGHNHNKFIDKLEEGFGKYMSKLRFMKEKV